MTFEKSKPIALLAPLFLDGHKLIETRNTHML